MSDASNKLTEDIVIQLREKVRLGQADLYINYAKQYNVSADVIGRAIRGKTFKRLNTIAPPVMHSSYKEAIKQQVIERHRNGETQVDLSNQLGLSKDSILTLCRDLVKEKEELLQHRKDTVRSLFLSGEHTLSAIARMTKTHRSTIREWCNDLKDTRVKQPKRVAPRESKAPFAPVPYEQYREYRSVVKGEQRVKLIHAETKSNITLVLPKYLMICKLGRLLTSNEFVVVKEGGDPARVEDLLILNKKQYRKHLGIPSKRVCKRCQTSFTPMTMQHIWCSKKCAVKRSKTSTQEYVRNCVICEEDFKAKTNKAEVCMSSACRSVLRNLK